MLDFKCSKVLDSAGILIEKWLTLTYVFKIALCLIYLNWLEFMGKGESQLGKDIAKIQMRDDTG